MTRHVIVAYIAKKIYVSLVTSTLILRHDDVSVTFHCVEKRPVPIPACRHQLIKCNLHVSSYVWIGVLVYCEGSRSVLDEEVRHTDLDLGKILS